MLQGAHCKSTSAVSSEQCRTKHTAKHLHLPILCAHVGLHQRLKVAAVFHLQHSFEKQDHRFANIHVGRMSFARCTHVHMLAASLWHTPHSCRACARTLTRHLCPSPSGHGTSSRLFFVTAPFPLKVIICTIGTNFLCKRQRGISKYEKFYLL